MERRVSEDFPWFTRIHFHFEQVKYNVAAAYCDGHVIADWNARLYVEPGFHAVVDKSDEYCNLYVALYEDGIGALPVYPINESTPVEWAMAQRLLETQSTTFEEELEDAEDMAELEAEARLTGIRYHL